MSSASSVQAKANRLLSESLTGNLVQYEMAKRWNGEMPQVSRSHHSPKSVLVAAVSGSIGSTGKPSSRQAAHPPVKARARFHPARLSSRTTRVLVSSFRQAQ